MQWLCFPTLIVLELGVEKETKEIIYGLSAICQELCLTFYIWLLIYKGLSNTEGFPCDSAGKQSGPEFSPWVGKIPWRRERLPIPVFWPGKFHGLYGPWGCKELNSPEWLSLLSYMYFYTYAYMMECFSAFKEIRNSCHVWHHRWNRRTLCIKYAQFFGIVLKLKKKFRSLPPMPWMATFRFFILVLSV